MFKLFQVKYFFFGFWNVLLQYFLYLFERQNYRDGETEWDPHGSCPRWPHRPEVGQSEAKRQDFLPVSHVGTTAQHLGHPLLLLRPLVGNKIGRETAGNGTSTHMENWCHKWRHSHLHSDAGPSCWHLKPMRLNSLSDPHFDQLSDINSSNTSFCCYFEESYFDYRYL